jgi:hypothetical protein
MPCALWRLATIIVGVRRRANIERKYGHKKIGLADDFRTRSAIMH